MDNGGRTPNSWIARTKIRTLNFMMAFSCYYTSARVNMNAIVESEK